MDVSGGVHIPIDYVLAFGALENLGCSELGEDGTTFITCF